MAMFACATGSRAVFAYFEKGSGVVSCPPNARRFLMDQGQGRDPEEVNPCSCWNLALLFLSSAIMRLNKKSQCLPRMQQKSQSNSF